MDMRLISYGRVTHRLSWTMTAPGAPNRLARQSSGNYSTGGERAYAGMIDRGGRPTLTGTSLHVRTPPRSGKSSTASADSHSTASPLATS